METAAEAWAQRRHRVRLEWGPAGAAAIGVGADVAVVVDVLSFTTTVTVAADLGVEVLPYRFRDATAEAFAADHEAALAVGRSEAGDDGLSLSPRSLRRAAERKALPRRLVLPSPNGATVAHQLSTTGIEVVAASLRNATAVGRWLHERGQDTVIAVVPAGERWPDDTLRPAVEDLWGAGAVVATLVDLGTTGLSPEAGVAAAAHRAVRGAESGALHACASGGELVANGYGGEIAVAAEVDSSDTVPVLQDGVFTTRRAP